VSGSSTPGRRAPCLVAVPRPRRLAYAVAMETPALRIVDDPTGEAVPADMRAWVIRPERLGEPIDAMQLETVEVPAPGPGEVLVRVMAAGVNYNLVWAAMGKPVSIFRYTGDDFHIGGSDASGIVAAVGAGVKRWQPGDEVVIHCNQSCGECPECNGLDPMACSEQKIWGYETNWGSFAD
jgi:crotonyl-CoA carboxylase/reductase